MFEDSYLDKYFKFDIPPLKISPFEINKEYEKIQELETLLDENDYKFIDNSKNLLPKVNITNITNMSKNINSKKSTNTKKQAAYQNRVTITSSLLILLLRKQHHSRIIIIIIYKINVI